MEAMEPLRNVLDRERAKYRETLKQAKKDATARQREMDAAKFDDALLATQMHEGRNWTAKLRNAEDRVAKANWKLEEVQAQSLADRMHEGAEWANEKLLETITIPRSLVHLQGLEPWTP